MSTRPKTEQQREEFLPRIATAFAELGYRGMTTAKLAALCDVRENILYRIWPSKKHMFLAAIQYVLDFTMQYWRQVIADGQEGATAAERILFNQARDHGEMRFYRIVFAGLCEEDPDIRRAMRDVYESVHQFLAGALSEHRGARRDGPRAPDPDVSAWALIGLGAVVDIQRELGVLPKDQREQLMREAGRVLLDGSNS